MNTENIGSLHNRVAPGTTYQLIVPPTEQQTRLDRFLSQNLPGYSRTACQELIEQGCVMVDSVIATKPSLPVTASMSLSITIPLPKPLPVRVAEAQGLQVELIHEHPDFLIINKPAGLIVHTPAPGHTELTLVDWLVSHFNDLYEVGSSDRPGIVHRLDRDTSGLMLVARNATSLRTLSDLFKDRNVKKEYLAVVEGHPPATGSVDLAIMRHPIHRTKMAPTKDRRGRTALTHYRVIEYFKENSLVALAPVTGRTHQIRVHMTALGHPLVGDSLYGSASNLIKRHALHATQLAFSYQGQDFLFTLEPSKDFQELVTKLK